MDKYCKNFKFLNNAWHPEGHYTCNNQICLDEFVTDTTWNAATDSFECYESKQPKSCKSQLQTLMRLGGHTQLATTMLVVVHELLESMGPGDEAPDKNLNT